MSTHTKYKYKPIAITLTIHLLYLKIRLLSVYIHTRVQSQDMNQETSLIFLLLHIFQPNPKRQEKPFEYKRIHVDDRLTL